MSEEKPKEETKDIVNDNVALLNAKIITQDRTIKELTEKLDAMTKNYTKAKEFLEQQAKGELIEYLAPRVDYPKEFLTMKTYDELSSIKSVVEKTVSPAFKSGTPVNYDKRPNARQQLDNMFAENMAKLRGGKFA